VPAPGIESSLQVLRTALRNRSLRRALVAFLLFNTQEYAVWVAVAVYAFQQGGAGEAGAVLVLQLVPAALVAPVAAVLADRIPRSQALVLGYGLQAGANTLLGLSLVVAPAPVAYAAAVVAACCITLTRPAHNAALPRLADTPGELTAANAASSTMDGLGTLIGPLAGGAIMASSGPGGAVLAMAVVSAASAFVALGIRVSHDDAVDPDEHVATFVAEALGGLRQARAEPDVAILLAVGGAQFVMVGMLDVFFALLAIDVLGSGESGAGVLAAGFGLGLLLGAAGAVGLVGVRRLAPAVLVALLGSGASLAALALASSVPLAVFVLALCGATIGLFAVSSRTLLQRRADDEVLARVFGLEEALQMVGLAVGAAAAPVLVVSFGARGALAAAGGLLALVALAASPRVRRIDATAEGPGPDFDLLRDLRAASPVRAGAARAPPDPGEREAGRRGDPRRRPGGPGLRDPQRPGRGLEARTPRRRARSGRLRGRDRPAARRAPHRHGHRGGRCRSARAGTRRLPRRGQRRTPESRSRRGGDGPAARRRGLRARASSRHRTATRIDRTAPRHEPK
jgi:predicted MFS family arabinose efflux permease